MTENKRYTVDTFIADYPCGFKDLEDNECEVRCDGKPMTYREVTDLLNEFNEENKELKKENQQLRELLENGLEVSQVEIDEELRRRKND